MDKKKKSIDEALDKLKEHIDAVEEHLKESNIYSLGKVECGIRSQKSVPIAGSKTDQWIVFGINPKMHANWEDEWGDNAIFTYWTDVKPQADNETWMITYDVAINFNTKRSEKKEKDKSVWHCREKEGILPSMEFVAIKKSAS